MIGRVTAVCLVLGLAGARAGAPAAWAAGGAAPTAPATVAPPLRDGEPMAFVGVGGVWSCADFTRAAASERASLPAETPPGIDPANSFRTTAYGALMAWADGYVTAKNEDELLHRTTGGGTTMLQRSRWLELFCQANPSTLFFSAVFRLREHLVAEGQ